MFIRLNQLKIDRKFSYTYNCPQYSPVLSSLNRLIRLQHQSASMYLLQVANQPQLNDIIFSFPMGFCVSFFCSSMFFNALLELLPTPWGRMSQAPCVNHALPLCTAVFGRTMLQRTRTLYDARRTRTLRRHLLLTCLYLLCFKDTVEFSTACTIPTYTAPQTLMCHGAFLVTCHAYVSDTHSFSKLTLGKLIYVFESNPTDSSVDMYDDATPLSFQVLNQLIIFIIIQYSNLIHQSSTAQDTLNSNSLLRQLKLLSASSRLQSKLHLENETVHDRSIAIYVPIREKNFLLTRYNQGTSCNCM